MDTFVSYVIQDASGHRHQSEIITTQSPPYTFSQDPQVAEVMEWAKKKKSTLKKEEELVIVSLYKI